MSEMTNYEAMPMRPRSALWVPHKGLSVHDDRVQRTDHLAILSAGYRDKGGSPVVSRDGTIHVSDPEYRAPGLAYLLAENGGKFLTVAVPSNNSRDFISESYRKEGKTRLELFGDDRAITWIKKDGTREVYAAGSGEYERARKACKVSISITLLLADFDAEGRPRVIFPDGIGTYRLRTTSENSRDNLFAQLGRIAGLTDGHVAGVPLELRLVNRTMAGPDGTKRNAPVFTFTLKHPGGLRLTMPEFRMIAAGAREELAAATLILPEAIDTIDGAERDLQMLGGDCEEADVRARWFAFVADTHLDSKFGRAGFLHRYTNGRTDSLASFLADATQEEAEAMLLVALDEIDRNRLKPLGRTDRETGEVLAAEASQGFALSPEEEARLAAQAERL